MNSILLRLPASTLLLIALVAVLALAVGLAWVLTPGSASSSSSLACSVRSNNCVGGEVEVFRMSATSNAHAAAAGSPTYTNLVCCGGVAGLGTNCSGNYDTVLALSGTDNAHVATAVGGSYATEVCLSAGAGAAVSCTYDDTCGGDYACLATISDSTNAHVADCDGTDDYATKVCCAVTAGGPPVGGIAQLPDASDSSGRSYVVLAGLAAALLVALTAGAWYARRRWLA